MFLKSNICFILLSLVVILGTTSGWSYDEDAPNGPKNWGQGYPKCDGLRQSPVNFVWFNATLVLTGPRVTVENIAKRPTSIKYENNGHGVTISLEFADGVQPRVVGGPLREDSFIFHHLHLHWGSEHSVDGKLLDGELHMVNYNSKYQSIEEAIGQPDGLAVLGFLYEVPPHALHPVFDVLRPLINATSNIVESGSVHVEDRNLFSLLEVFGTASFGIAIWSYNGSLTTPSCDEVVTWMVYKFPIWIHPSELRLLRSLKDDHGEALVRNNRPLQPLNGRTIFCY